MNDFQIDLIRKYVRGESVDNISTGALGSHYTDTCAICNEKKLYPLLLGLGPEAQIIHKLNSERERYIIVCESCLSSLRTEWARWNLFDRIMID